MERIFEAKVTIITGGNVGIGRAAAIAFAKSGAKVVIADRMQNQETLDTIRFLSGLWVAADSDHSYRF